MVLCSSREIASLKFKKKLAGPPVYYTGSNEPSHAPKFECPDNTYKSTWTCYQRAKFLVAVLITYVKLNLKKGQHI
jgi:hypothetical protein